MLHHHTSRAIISEPFLAPFELYLNRALKELFRLKLDSLEDFVRSALSYMAAEAEHRYKASLVASDVVFLKLNFEQQA